MTEPPDSITIRALYTLDEYREAEIAQRDLWQLHDDVQIVPLHVLLTAQKNGGLVAGAFQDHRMIGFLFGFLGLTPGGTLKHCSHLLCIHPDMRRSGIGEQLKRFQFAFVQAQKIVPLIGWTFDPLESVNARLNIAKLRGVVRSYSRDIYGAMNDGLNAGLPSDRLNVEWWVDRADRLIPPIRSTRAMLIEAGAVVVNATMGDALQPRDLPTEWDTMPDTVLVEIPSEMQMIKRVSIDLALQWRLNVRSALEALFTRGFAIVDFIYERGTPDQSPAHSFYVLRRGIDGTPL